MIARAHSVALALIAAASAAAIGACGTTAQQAERVVANDVGHAGNTIGDDMARAYELEGRVAAMNAAAAMPRGAKRADVEAAIDAAQARVRAKWIPIWAALDRVSAGDNAAASAIEAGQAPSLATMNSAVCDLLLALSVDAPTVDTSSLDALAVGCMHHVEATDAGAPSDGGAAPKDGGSK